MKNVNLIEMLHGCSKRNGMAVSASNPDGQPTVNRQSRLMSHRGYLRNLAMIFAVLTLACGQMWGTNQTYPIASPSQNTYTDATSGITVIGTSGSGKIDNKTSQKVYLAKQQQPLYISSIKANIKGVSFEYDNASSSSTQPTITITTGTNAELATPVSGFSATVDGNSQATLSGIAIANDQSTHKSFSVTFTNAISMFSLVTTGSNAAQIRNISITYDDAISAPSLYATITPTGTDAYSVTSGKGSMTSADVTSTTTTIGGNTYYKIDSGDNTYTPAENLSTGDIVVFTIGSSSNAAIGFKVLNAASGDMPASILINKGLASTAYQIVYVVPSTSSCIRFKRNSSNDYLKDIKVYHTAASPCSDETGLAYGTGTVTKTYGDAVFTNTLTNPNSLGVTYSSTNTDVATVNSSTGAVTIKAAGTTTITATWAGNATYCAGAVSYTLNVKPAVGSVSGAWDRFGGETISLSVTPSGGSSYTYQWQKYNGSGWDNVSNGTVSGATTTGATSANLQIANCGGGNSGTYRCQVTAGSQTNETDGLQVKVFTLECYNGGTTVYNFTRDGENQAGSVEIDLAANTAYTFKFHVDNTYYGNNASINEDITNYVFCNSDNGENCASNFTVNSGLGGTFTFTMDYSTGGNSSVLGEPELSVTYPRKRIYLSPGVWTADGAKFAIYYYLGVNNGWTDFMTPNDCGMSAEIPQWNGVTMIAARINGALDAPEFGDGKCWNQTGNLTVTSNDYIVVNGWDNITYNSTYSIPTYTISYNAGTGGSGSKASESKTCGVAFTLPNSAVFTRTGYTQTGWTTSDGGAQEYALGGTYTTNEDKTFYPVWTVNNYTLTWNLAGGKVTVAGTGAAVNATGTPSSEVAFGTAITAPTVTKANYTFSAWSPTVASTMPAANTTYTATFTANQYSVTHSLTGVTTSSGATGSNAATYGTDYSATFAASSGYTLPSTITVTIGGASTTHYTWNSSTGTVVVDGDYITGAIVITVTGESAVACGITLTQFGTQYRTSSPRRLYTYTSNSFDERFIIEASGSNEHGVTYSSTDSLYMFVNNGQSFKVHASDVLKDSIFEDVTKIKFKYRAGKSGKSITLTFDVYVGGTKVGTVSKAITDQTWYTETINVSPAKDGRVIFKNTGSSSDYALHFDEINICGTLPTSCDEITPTWSTDYTSPTLNVGGTSSTPVVGKDGSSGAVTFSSSATDIATVNSSGVVTAVKTGTAIITATVAADDENNKCEGTVTKTFTIKAGVTYNKNGADSGDAPTDANTYAANADVTILGNTGSMVEAGKVFNGWNTKSDGTGTHYEVGATMKMPNKSAGVTLYAEWVGYATSWEWWNSGASNDGTTFTYLTSKNYVLSFASSGSTAIASWDMSGGAYYKGVKIKTKDHSMSFWVQTGKSVSITFGTRPTKPTFTVGGVDKSSEVGASDNKDSVTVTYTTSADTKFYIENETSTGTAFTIKRVLIEDVAAEYTLAWNSNGGSELTGDYTTGTVTAGDAITAPNDPTLSNYTFDGWKTNNDGTGTTAGSTMPAANTTYYAAWKQTLTLKTGAQGSGADKTPYVYINGATLNGFNAHSADGYTLQGYYTVGSGGVKVLNADGTFASANVDGYITSSKWSRTGAAPTLFAQWVATEDCHTLKYAWKITGKFCDDGSTSVTASDTVRFPANASNLYFTVSGTGNTVSKGSSYNLGNTQNNYFLLTAKTGYQIKSICFYGKVQDSSVDYTTDGSSWSSLTSTNTSGDDYYSFSSINASAFGIKLTAATPEGVWIRNMVIEVCAEGGTTYNVTYDDNGSTGGTAPTDNTDYDYGDAVTVKGNTGELEKTNYTFAGWSTNNDGTGSNYVADNTFSITGNTTLYAKWTQTVTLNKNGGSTDGSATAIWNATGLTGITHAKPVSGYKLLGYYSAASNGTKVLNSDGSFAATNVTGYITSGKWSRTSATTLYAEYESAGALTWNLIVNSDTANLSTSTKTSAFTEISTANMSNATVNGLTYTGDAKASLTGKISTPAYDAGKYVYVTFQVADGYKFTPSMIQVPVQPVGNGEHKAVELRLTDTNTHSLVSGSATKCDGTEKGKKTTVTLAGNGTYFTGTVTLKIYVYPHTDATATKYNCYRLGTPITIEGEIEEACATMPSYRSMSYTTTTFLPNADASGSPITIVGGTNIDTYQWKYNTVNDRTSGTNCGTGTSLTPLTDVASGTTRYYWCEMTNDACGITIKSPAVAITVASAKSDATVTWTDPASTPNYGGGGYTIKATVETGWDGNAADLVITAPAGINIYNVSSGTDGSSRKYVQADFDVQTSFDRTTYASNIPFTVSAAATASYNAISNDHNTAYSACSGGGVGSSYNIRVRKSYDKDASNNYRWVTPGAGEITYAVGSSISSGKAGTAMATVFDSIMSSDKQYIWVKTFVDNIKQMRLYVETSGANVSVSALYQRTTYAAADAKDVITGYSVVYDEDDDAENTGTKGQHTIDLIFTSALSANDIICVKFSSSKVKALGAAITEGSAGSLNTYLQWSGDLENGATVDKYTTDAYFTYSASKITDNTNTLGAITYSSSDPSVATVDATGKVALVAAGSTTIKATLAASGCYKKAEISYTLNVTEVACAITAGTLTLTSGTESKCSSDNVTLTLTGFESDASIQWKDGDTDINNGGNYEIATDGTTSTLTTNQPGTYSVMVTSGCSVRSNRITISNKSTEVGAKRIVKNWYIKNGRPTPDIELWTLQNGAHLSSVAWDPANTTGLTASDFYESDGKVYLKGKEPSSNASGADIDYTLTLTVEDDCGSTTEMSASEQQIYLHHQKNTDKHVLAFVVTGTEKGGFTEGITAAQTTSVELYNTIAANFDVLATNVYSTDDEQALKEYYSQFDILCVTDYPNTGTKGVNKKSYVDALGALVDIRPILTMEAFVAKLANWKAKGISGTPQSPTTRQYSMLLQCKDHEIFAGTKLTKVGEGDETMYRVSMVCDTLEDYKTLDATYGAGTHEKDKNYQYGKKPALQGFTFTKEMLDDDLLPLGLIDDGSGNDLQVGIERQTEMEARLMVLGINSYAMERLTDDGQTVVVNALKYLMKKNSEDIADCSNTFVGGDDDEDESTRDNWDVASHWSGNAVPDRTQKVRIVAPCVIPANVKPHVTGVIIAPSGKYNHGANTANGSLTIAAGGALIVDGKVEAATAPLYTETRATSAEDLTIQTSSTAQGALIFDNDKGDTKATVNLYSLGRKPSSYQYQYFAVPMEVVPVNPTFANETHGGTGIYTYVYEEASSGWTRRKYYDDLFAFEGLGITTKSETAMNYTMAGNLASTATKEITLTHDGAGLNLIGNSWMAPIQIGALAEDNTDANITQTVYIYCAGRDAEGGAVVSSDDTETAGQWLAVPFEAAEFETWKEAGKLSVIPAMQAFQIKVADEATLTLDYDKVVRGSTNDLNAKLRAPGRRMAANEVTMTNIRVADSKTHTDLSLFEGDRFSEAFDNGWEAEYMNGDGRSAKLYAETEAGQMAVAAMYDYEGTVVGFVPGQETEYTFSFMGEDNGYYLNDIKLQNSVRISEGETYTFTYEEGDAANRFYISRTPIDAPQTSTGVDNTGNGEVKARKFIYRDKMYILINGRVYSADGALVK